MNFHIRECRRKRLKALVKHGRVTEGDYDENFSGLCSRSDDGFDQGCFTRSIVRSHDDPHELARFEGHLLFGEEEDLF